MTTEHVTALSEMERDALSEISNIAMARAAEPAPDGHAPGPAIGAGGARS